MKELNNEIRITIIRSMTKLSNIKNKIEEINSKIISLQKELNKLELSAEQQQRIIENIGRKPLEAPEGQKPYEESKILSNKEYNLQLEQQKVELINSLQKEESSSRIGSTSEINGKFHLEDYSKRSFL